LDVLTLATLWLGLALLATLISHWFKIAIALTEIFVGILVQFLIVMFIGGFALGSDEPWI